MLPRLEPLEVGGWPAAEAPSVGKTDHLRHLVPLVGGEEVPVVAGGRWHSRARSLRHRSAGTQLAAGLGRGFGAASA